MPLVITTRIVQIVDEEFLDDHDVEQTMYGVAKTIETMKGAFKCGIASSSLHSTPWYTVQDDEWWQEKLRNCMDPVWLQKNRVESLGPKVNWGDMPIYRRTGDRGDRGRAIESKSTTVTTSSMTLHSKHGYSWH